MHIAQMSCSIRCSFELGLDENLPWIIFFIFSKPILQIVTSAINSPKCQFPELTYEEDVILSYFRQVHTKVRDKNSLF